ncbi:MAG: Sec-independent protein translocase protein TatA [Pedosphaera sp.]|nr:Sec-independent protein translocase protein TatA [Pedosphaera sp.]
MLASTFFGGWEIVLILAMVLLVFGSKRRPDLIRGLRQGIDEFCKAIREVNKRVLNGLDQPTIDAGRSVGGIYGKPAAEALTPDNQTAELYDPAVFRKQERNGGFAKIAVQVLISFLRRAAMIVFRGRK